MNCKLPNSEEALGRGGVVQGNGDSRLLRPTAVRKIDLPLHEGPELYSTSACFYGLTPTDVNGVKWPFQRAVFRMDAPTPLPHPSDSKRHHALRTTTRRCACDTTASAPPEMHKSITFLATQSSARDAWA
uniref:Uncharacterized protein n=1 Tax=Eutreptiella gymnastica TaxID=73025 RepID=A0A7S4GH23_9EUGL|mmetsp:Transcript_9545/g.14701  ORF Transcript_9545/g.14701 Transcript_9545/m.14701 type:complete len:130 (-) Transcript_9545:340-729(-)